MRWLPTNTDTFARPRTIGRRGEIFMTEVRKIETGQSLVFDALVGGAVDAPLVLLLHGFAEYIRGGRRCPPWLQRDIGR